MRGRLPTAVALLALGCALFCGRGFSADEAATPAARPIKNLRIPLELYEDGKIKTQLTAGFAHVPLSGPIEGTSVKIEFYGRAGNIESSVFADDCRYEKDKGVATSDSNVRLEKDGVIITGRGFVWDAREQTVEVLNDVKVVLKGNLKIKKRQ